MNTQNTISFEEKFKKVLKPSMDRNIDSEITNSMSEVALRKFIGNKKNNVNHILEMKSMAQALN